ncbi:MAG: nitroreductase/quinone reductase family protein [Candidatus Dormibacteria bacterium]
MWPKRAAALEVRGRRTGRNISVPVVITAHHGERYLVSMLGDEVNWVRNVRAAGDRAVLRHGLREAVRLEEVSADARPAILRRYLALAPGARPHISVDRHASVEQFERIAPDIPVFRILPLPPSPTCTLSTEVGPPRHLHIALPVLCPSADPPRKRRAPLGMLPTRHLDSETQCRRLGPSAE